MSDPLVSIISIVSIIRLTLHFVSPKASHTALSPHLSPFLLPLPSQLAFVPYPLASISLLDLAVQDRSRSRDRKAVSFDGVCFAVRKLSSNCLGQ